MSASRVQRDREKGDVLSRYPGQTWHRRLFFQEYGHNRGKHSTLFLRGASEELDGNKGTPVCLWGSRAGGGEGGPTKDPQLCVCKQGS